MWGQGILQKRISDSLTVIARTYIYSDTINNVKINVNRPIKHITVTASDNFGYIPFRKENIDRINSALKSILHGTYPNYTIQAKAFNKNIEELIPDYLSEQPTRTEKFSTNKQLPPLVTKLSVPYAPDNGLMNKYIALWNSHGLHYNNNANQWTWQRPLMFLSVEDLLTTSYVLPFLVPMLENAGAQVFLPRERDFRTDEIIVDRDDDQTMSLYRENNDRYHWHNEKLGFSNSKDFYLYGENPFEMGTYRHIKTTTDPDAISTAEWIPYIPKKGMYAVYIAYQTTENSTEDALYTVHHMGGKTEFAINQTMFGGSWLYLGHFLFDQGIHENGKVTLNNLSKEKGKTLTADAVKFGGGIGNIAVLPKKFPKNGNNNNNNNNNNNGNENGNNQINEAEPVLSHFPRFTEGAKYWLQWAGVPDSIYSRTENTNEYSDDFQSRGFWVNYLAGGSSVMPETQGLGIPINLSMGIHTDAGLRQNDSIVGTLGICTVENSDKSSFYKNGVSRWTARDMVDLIQTQIVEDIRAQWDPEWTRRGVWNKSYSESRVPEVPAMILEMFSHQNFNDMKYALDPRFRFTMSRAIYKGILKFIAWQNDYEYVVQPLPVKNFSCLFLADNKIKLHWEAVCDSLEPTALPDSYIVYTRINDGGFDNGQLVHTNSFESYITPGNIYSYKITAVNRGGESFPSETLSAYRDPNNTETVLILNGFNRISGPEHFHLITLAGFLTDRDAGVPYISDVSFTGPQYEFSVNAAYETNEYPGFGASKSCYEDMVVAGNTFDYPYLHGQSIKNAGYSFVSANVQSILADTFDLNQFKVLDLILGKQKQTAPGKMKKTLEFQTFPLDLQSKLADFCKKGGNMMISGAYVASDTYDENKGNAENFVCNILKIMPAHRGTTLFSGIFYESNHPEFKAQRRQFEYHHTLNNEMYAVESPDILGTVDENAFVICTYEGSDYPAGIAYANDDYKVCTFAFPFETIKDKASRDTIMTDVLHFLFNKTQ